MRRTALVVLVAFSLVLAGWFGWQAVDPIFALAIGWFVFSEVPTWTMLAGASLVVTAGCLIIWREHQLGLERARQRKAMSPQG